MKKSVFVSLMMVVGLILGSCSSSNQVVSNRLVAKRKYNKGFHINKKSTFKDSKKNVAYEEVKNESSPEVKTKRDSRKIERDNAKSTRRQIAQVVESSNASGSEESFEKETVEFGSTSMDGLSDSPAFDTQAIQETTQKKTSERTSSMESKSAQKKSARTDTTDPLMIVILVLLCLFLPPVAVAIVDGITTMFWVDLLLFLIAIGGFWLLPGLAYLCGLAAVILAFLVVFDVI